MKISKELEQRLDERGITVSGMETVESMSQRYGHHIHVPETGKYYMHAAVGRNTIWVEYELTEDGEKLVTDAYAHRMSLNKEYHPAPAELAAAEKTEKDPDQPYCVSCDCNLVEEKLYLHYLCYPFSITTPRCPQCGQAYLSPRLMAEKVEPMEKNLEDK